MKIVIISDIHGNLEAFTAVLNDMNKENYDMSICLGDIVGYGPDPSACIKLIKDNNIECLLGNHDAAVCEIIGMGYFNVYAKKAIEWTSSVLSGEEKNFLRELPLRKILKNIIFIHGALNDPFDYILDFASLKLNTDLLQKDYPEQNICFFGHTHVAFLSRGGTFELPEKGRHKIEDYEKQIVFINPGSVGQPRGGLSNSASYCILNTEIGEVNFREVKYDIDKTYKKIIKKGLPQYLGERLFKGF